MNIETVFDTGTSTSNRKSELEAVGTRSGVESTGVGEGLEGRTNRKELGVGGGHKLGLDCKVFAPGMVTIFFDLDLIGARVEVEGVVSGSGEPTIDIDLSARREAVGREETGAFNKTSATETITLGIADDEVCPEENKEDGSKEDEGSEDRVAALHN